MSIKLGRAWLMIVETMKLIVSLCISRPYSELILFEPFV